MGYRLSFVLGGALVAGAFIAQYLEMRKSQPFRNDTAPWALFIGGMFLLTIGWREFRKKSEK